MKSSRKKSGAAGASVSEEVSEMNMSQEWEPSIIETSFSAEGATIETVIGPETVFAAKPSYLKSVDEHSISSENSVVIEYTPPASNSDPLNVVTTAVILEPLRLERASEESHVKNGKGLLKAEDNSEYEEVSISHSCDSLEPPADDSSAVKEGVSCESNISGSPAAVDEPCKSTDSLANVVSLASNSPVMEEASVASMQFSAAGNSTNSESVVNGSSRVSDCPTSGISSSGDMQSRKTSPTTSYSAASETSTGDSAITSPSLASGSFNKEVSLINESIISIIDKEEKSKKNKDISPSEDEVAKREENASVSTVSLPSVQGSNENKLKILPDGVKEMEEVLETTSVDSSSLSEVLVTHL